MKALVAVRVQQIKSMATIRMAEAHGKREDEVSEKRVEKSRTVLNLVASRYSPAAPLELEIAYKAFKEATGASEGKGAAIMAHMIAVISPDVLAETGDPRDPNNPQVQALFEQAQAWARSEFGEESLIAARLDVDEKGAGVVDLFVCPTAMQSGGRGRKPKLTISVKSGLEAVAKKYPMPPNEDGTPVLNKYGRPKKKRNYSALQDSWGDWASQHIDQRLRRGDPKKETQRKHVHADLLRERAEELDRRERAIEEKEWNTAEIVRAIGKDEIRLSFQGGKHKTATSTTLSEERRAALKQMVRSLPSDTRSILAEVTELKLDATATKEAAQESGHDAILKAMQSGAEAFYRREVIGAEEAPEMGWRINYSDQITERRRSVLSAILEPFRSVVAPFIAAIARAVRRWDVTAKEVADERNDSGWDYGPGL
ncbi:hypothetical protein GOB93_08930 [Acetobacter musti]|uniref:MobA/MobL protein domain-containing protein n=1 Tax=Acetobacter musti TaxID=864732 RepID=A0ABX0JP57_9PROT|nr:hypothetical protein [Acetobacter musti]NHN84765.1 hypothetical protein [Acetobacter musti]